MEIIGNRRKKQFFEILIDFYRLKWQEKEYFKLGSILAFFLANV